MSCGLVAQWLCTRLSLRASLQDAYLVPEIRVAGGSNPSWAAFLFFKTIKKKEGIGYGGYLTLLFFQSSFGACFNRYPSKKMKAIFSRMARMPCLLVSMWSQWRSRVGRERSASARAHTITPQLTPSSCWGASCTTSVWHRGSSFNSFWEGSSLGLCLREVAGVLVKLRCANLL